MAESIPQKRSMLFEEESEKRQNGSYKAAKRQKVFSGPSVTEVTLAMLARKRQEEAGFVVGSENWENVYSYEEKRLKSIVDGEEYHKWEKDNRSWEIKNHQIPIVEDWEEEYSCEEKRLRSLVDEDGYYTWEQKNWLWERDNHRVPEEEISPEEENRRRNLRFVLSLSLPLPLQDQRKAKEIFDKTFKERPRKVLTEEEKRLKESYLEKMENFRTGSTKETFFPFGPGWDLVYNNKTPKFRTLESLQSGETQKFLPTPECFLHLCEKRQPTEGCSTPVISREEEREKLAAEERCLDGYYLTPYCKCNKQCYQFDTALEDDPPECLPIWLAYCRQFRQSHCFDIDDYIGGRVCPLQPSQNFDGNAEIMMELANRAIQGYNEKECNVFKYKVLKIEKVNYSPGGYFIYWMTVKVLNLTLGTPIETFQIHAGISLVNDEKVIYCCRPKEEAIIGMPSCEFCFGLLAETPITGGKEP